MKSPPEISPNIGGDTNTAALIACTDALTEEEECGV